MALCDKRSMDMARAARFILPTPPRHPPLSLPRGLPRGAPVVFAMPCARCPARSRAFAAIARFSRCSRYALLRLYKRHIAEVDMLLAYRDGYRSASAADMRRVRQARESIQAIRRE